MVHVSSRGHSSNGRTSGIWCIERTSITTVRISDSTLDRYDFTNKCKSKFEPALLTSTTGTCTLWVLRTFKALLRISNYDLKFCSIVQKVFSRLRNISSVFLSSQAYWRRLHVFFSCFDTFSTRGARIWNIFIWEQRTHPTHSVLFDSCLCLHCLQLPLFLVVFCIFQLFIIHCWFQVSKKDRKHLLSLFSYNLLFYKFQKMMRTSKKRGS